MPKSVLIVGCGVFGLSTAFNLAQQGYKVTSIDKYPVPSPESAANDLNKIIRTEYADPFYAKLAIEAYNQWMDDPLYKDVYVNSGRVMISPLGLKNQHRAKFERKGYQNLKDLGFDISGLKTIKNGKELGNVIIEFNQNKFNKLNAKFNPNSGFGKARESLVKIYKECQKIGVRFIFGPEGTAIRHTNDSIIVSSGDIYKADQIIIAMGASTGLLVDLKNQVRSLGLFITHIHLTEQEYQKYKNMPIFFSSELGYFFPPDSKTHDLKIALTFGDTFNRIVDPNDFNNEIYIPRFNTNDTFPRQGEKQVRDLLNLVIPELSKHELYKSKVCWISDSSTSDFIIDKVPDTENIFVATGDSGHGYKFLPNIGKYIGLKLQDKLDQESSHRWRWKTNPKFPTQFATRAKRGHFEIKEIKNWWIDSKL